MPQVLQIPAVRDDLLQIGRFIAQESQSLDTAIRFLDKIEQRCQLYATQPLMGTTRPDLGNQIHTFAVDSYVVIYQPIDDGIRVLMVVHGTRDIPPIFKQRQDKPTE